MDVYLRNAQELRKRGVYYFPRFAFVSQSPLDKSTLCYLGDAKNSLIDSKAVFNYGIKGGKYFFFSNARVAPALGLGSLASSFG